MASLWYLSRPSFFSSRRTQRGRTPHLHLSALPSPKPCVRRRNHLRRKLLLPLQPGQTESPQRLSCPSPSEVSEITSVDTDKPEEFSGALNAELGVDPFGSAAPFLSLDELVGLALRFGLLIAVQTVVAVWFLGRNGGGENTEERNHKREGLGGRSVEQEQMAVGYEEKVAMIREMAKAVRLAENGVFHAGEKRMEEKLGRKTVLLNGLTGESSAAEDKSGRTSAKSPGAGKKGKKKTREVSGTVGAKAGFGSEIPTGAGHVKTCNGDFAKCGDEEVASKGGMEWWSKLPYVMGIYLGRGADLDGPRGLYCLKLDDENSLGPAYTITFQDRGDAINFSILLESFFEGLENANVHVVPLTIQEVTKSVNSGLLEVFVVRKGQIKLYVGQPLSEVESQIRSLIATRIVEVEVAS